MPQNGFHGLVGLATARRVGKYVPAVGATAWVTGIILGAMLPDIDMYPAAIGTLLLKRDMVSVFHRNATHSLLAVVVLLVIGWLLKKNSPKWGYGLLGIALGMATHEIMDIFFWFASLDLFWPFSRIAGSALHPINLWNGYQPPHIVVNIREAFEFGAFAMLLLAIARIVRRQGGETRGLVKWQAALWVAFAIAIVTAFVFRDNERNQNYIVTTPYLLIVLPYCWWQVWKNRAALAAWARG